MLVSDSKVMKMQMQLWNVQLYLRNVRNEDAEKRAHPIHPGTSG